MQSIANVLKISALTIFSVATFNTPAKAEIVDSTRVVFDHKPNLPEATTLDQTPLQNGRYHFVIHIPENAGEALKAIVITPQNQARNIDVDLSSVTARQGVAYANGEAINLASVGGESDNSEKVWVVFDEPVAPGETVTVTLTTSRNPADGV